MEFFEGIGFIFANYWLQLLQGVAATIILAIIGTVVGLLLGILLGLGKNLKVNDVDRKGLRVLKRFIIALCNIYSVVLRGTPMMVQALIFKAACVLIGINWTNILYGVPVLDGWLVAGLIVISFNTAAYMCEIVRSGLNGVDKGQEEGAKSIGMGSFTRLSIVVLPQALRNSLPTIGNELIVNIKDSSVLNVIGVTELFYISKDISVNTYNQIGTYVIIAFIYLILTLLSTGILKLIENKMDGKEIHINPFKHYKISEAK